MTQSTSIQPTSKVGTASTAPPTFPKTRKVEQCHQCPFFKNYNEANGRGWCELNNHMSRTFFKPVTDCKFKIAALHLPEDYFSVSVHIISHLLVPQDGYPMPDDERVVEVKVPEITLEQIENALSKVIDVESYQIFSFWQTQIEDPHFSEF